MRSVGPPARRAVARAACLGAAACCFLLTISSRDISPIERSYAQEPSASVVPRDEALVRATCGGCHALPPPEILPRSAWRSEFVKMMFLRDNRPPPVGPAAAANVTLPKDMEQVLAYYTAAAPDRLQAPEAWPAPSESPITFVRSTLSMPEMPGPPAVSNIRVADIDGDKQLDLLGTDMRQGVVFAARPLRGARALSTVASIPHPSHVSTTDLDRDGAQDLIVSDLGEFFPSDHDKGAVILLRAQGGGRFGAFWLDGWPRVAAAQAADFNGDGKDDLAVSAFGWRKTGELTILENRTTNPVQPSFANHKIDPRTGSLSAWPADLDRDGKMDLVAVLAQEHETVVAYLNTGGFTFTPKVIYAAPHPNWGSSGMQLVDLDVDGDLDVLLTHGDTFDDGIVKPYHGIQWLENKGGYPFVEHTLAQMPGVHSARAADLDGDGDLDVVAAALLAGGSDVDERELPALIWLEQTSAGTFLRHTIEMGFPRHATIDVADIDGDGDTDIVAGNFSLEKATSPWVEVWVNGRK
jgi:hypothetical protein